MQTYALIIATLISTSLFAQKKQDKQSIKDQCGCYEVDFRYAETFSPDSNYQFHDRYQTSGLEWISLVEESPDQLVIQHILVINDTFAMKHWRQDWVYENAELYTFAGDRTWNYEMLSNQRAQGQWTQKVYQVDDSPRYEGSATWVHEDGRHYWESTVDAPLPRREYTHRDDYNIMRRTNRHEITDKGHIHEQDNAKVNREGNERKVLAYEKGMNTYRQVDDARCRVAAEWWTKNEPFWADVRTVWNEVFDRQQTLQLQAKVNDQRLYERLFPLNEELVSDAGYDSETGLQRIRAAIEPFVVPVADLAAGQ